MNAIVFTHGQNAVLVREDGSVSHLKVSSKTLLPRRARKARADGYTRPTRANTGAKS